MDFTKHLPLDLANEIFTSATSLATLDAGKLVCRDWNELLHTADFMPRHCKATKNVCGFISQWRRKTQEFISPSPTQINDEQGRMLLNGDFSEQNVRIVASSKHGILCVLGREQTFYVGKPTTGQWQRVPPLPDAGTFQTVNVALVMLGMNPFRYKIIRLSLRDMRSILSEIPRYSIHDRYRCEVFDSKTWEWKRAKGIELGYEVSLEVSSQPVQVGKQVYWLTDDQQVLVFDSDDETHHLFPLPETELNDDPDFIKHFLVDYDGKLGLLNWTGDAKTEVWVLMDVGWMLIEEFEVPESLRCRSIFPVRLYNRHIAMSKPEGNEAVFYNLSDSSILKSVQTRTPESLQEIFQFRSDFEPVNLGGERSFAAL